MHGQAIRVWCLIAALLLAACEARVEVKTQPRVVFGEPTVSYIELKAGTVTSKVKLLNTEPPVTLSLVEDSSDNTSFVSRTEHNCDAGTSTLKYLAVFDEKRHLVSESDQEVELDVDPDSLGEAELKLACPKVAMSGRLNA